MPFDTLTIRLTDGIKGAVDYSPNKLYELTAVLSNPTEAEVASTVAMIVKTGEGFLGRAPQPVTALTTKARKAVPATEPEVQHVEPTFPDPLAGGALAASDNLGDILGAPPKEITDEEVIHAIMQRNEALKNAAPIRALVETFNPAPGLRVFKATEIEQPKRAEFLTKLAAL